MSGFLDTSAYISSDILLLVVMVAVMSRIISGQFHISKRRI
jgi:hypothetical protein